MLATALDVCDVGLGRIPAILATVVAARRCLAVAKRVGTFLFDCFGCHFVFPSFGFTFDLFRFLVAGMIPYENLAMRMAALVAALERRLPVVLAKLFTQFCGSLDV